MFAGNFQEHKLSLLGGTKYIDAVNNMMALLFTDILAYKCVWVMNTNGRNKPKLKFYNFGKSIISEYDEIRITITIS